VDAEVMDAPMARADATPRADAASARDAEALPEPPDTGCGCQVRGAKPRAEPWFLGLMLALAWGRARRVRPRERGDITQD
jgi:MYXO-CTERM domain-containing protein